MIDNHVAGEAGFRRVVPGRLAQEQHRRRIHQSGRKQGEHQQDSFPAPCRKTIFVRGRFDGDILLPGSDDGLTRTFPLLIVRKLVANFYEKALFVKVDLVTALR